MDTQFLEQYYSEHDEDARFLLNHGQVEYQTTLRYIHRYLKRGMRVLEIGAGTGRYSLALAHEGYRVDAIELLPHNLEILHRGILPSDQISAQIGNALDLSRYGDHLFDITLILGPLYHLYTEQDRLTAMREALRVTRPGGYIFAAYCMNEATVLSFGFKKGQIHDCLQKGMLTDDFHCLSKPEDVFVLSRTEDIAELDAQLPADRVALIAADGPTNYMRETVDAMDEKTFALFLSYHFCTCERPDLIGASHHCLDILCKKENSPAQ